jgi:UDP-glucose 4-epimerase
MNGRVLVTGGAGFIGSHLTDRLLAEDYRVTVLDDFSSGRPENLEEARRAGDLRVVEGSILDQGALESAIKGCDRVFHLAVQCVRRSLGRPLDNHEINATGTLRVLEAARRAKVERFVYCSSSEVYGNTGSGRLSEDETICKPVTVYGGAKLAGELYASAYWQTYGLPVVIVRPFNAYGPREHESGDLAEVIPRFVIRVLNDLPPIIFGSGDNGRDFTYVTETAHGIALAADCDGLLGRIVNIAYGRVVSIREVANLVVRLCGRPSLAPVHIEPRPGDVHTLHADTTVAQKLLGFRPGIDFEQGLGRYIDRVRGRRNDVSGLLEADPRNWQMPAH